MILRGKTVVVGDIKLVKCQTYPVFIFLTQAFQLCLVWAVTMTLRTGLTPGNPPDAIIISVSMRVFRSISPQPGTVM